MTASKPAAGFRVVVDPGKCVGSGQCVIAEPEVFDQREEDGLVFLMQEHPDHSLRAHVERAARLCPAQAISLHDE